MPRQSMAQKQAVLEREAVLCRRQLGAMETQAFKRAKALEAKGDLRQRARATECFSISRSAFNVGRHIEEALAAGDRETLQDAVRRARMTLGDAQTMGL